MIGKIPEGTVTFLFTDIEGSTRLLRALGTDLYGQVLSDQRAIIRAAFDEFNGTEIDTQGDAFFASFPRASEAAAAVVQIQRELASHNWPEGVEARVRMGLHTGEPLVAEEGYIGMDVHRAARIAHIGHGGQVLVSEATAVLLKRDLPDGTTLDDLGEYQLKDLRSPWRIYQLSITGLEDEFPDLKAPRVKAPSQPSDQVPRSLPAFLQEGAADQEGDRPAFVVREGELAWLEKQLSQSLAGQGRVVFVTGEVGDGKSALLDAFGRQAQVSHENLLVVQGICNSFSGTADVYLPFRSILKMLTGDVEALWASGRISQENAGRLWEALPFTLNAVLSHGQSLLDMLLPAVPLKDRAEAAGLVNEVLRLDQLLENQDRRLAELGQGTLAGQIVTVLGAISDQIPLILTLDDLQWADEATLNLLFRMSEELAASQLLIVGAYRPEEVALGQGGERHPLEKVLAELKRSEGDVVLPLPGTTSDQGRTFVDALLDTEPNRFSLSFREALAFHTAGQPLFTIELLRDLQERGDLIQDAEGVWNEGPELDWTVLPVRVEGVIEERIGRLEDELREILTIASVEGEEFTAQVVARVQEIKARGLLRRLNHELDQQHRLVQEQGKRELDQQQLFLCRFRHSLFQQHLYNGISAAELQLLHGEVGQILEEIYGNQAAEIAPQLALHFSKAGEAERAIQYLLLAGDQFRLMYAREQATEAYEQALGLQKELGDFDATARTLMKLGLTYHNAFEFQQAQQVYDEAEIYQQKARQFTPADYVPAHRPLRVERKLAFGSLDPGFIHDADGVYYAVQLFRGLFENGPEGEVIPDLARSWEVSEDGLTYVFHLQENAVWSDGEPVTAHDFEFAWKRILDPDTSATGLVDSLYVIQGAQAYHSDRAASPDLVGVRAMGKYRLEVTLEEQTSHFLALLASVNYYAIPKHIVEKHGAQWASPDRLVNNGPFQIQSWNPAEVSVLIRNPDYQGNRTGNIEELHIGSGDRSWEENLELYAGGELDVTRLNRHTWHARQWYPEEYHMRNEPATMFNVCHIDQPPMDDRRVRRALVMALDRKKLVENFSYGAFYPAEGGFVPPGMPGHSHGIGLPYQPEQARQLLAQAGYPGGQNFPILKFVGTESNEAMCRLMIEFWSKDLDIEIEFENLDWVDMVHAHRSGHLHSITWSADIPDPFNFLKVSVGRHAGAWKNQEYDQLLENARRTMDQGQRIALYQKADRILMDEAVIVPLAYDALHWLVKPDVKIPLRSDETLILKHAVIEPPN